MVSVEDGLSGLEPIHNDLDLGGPLVEARVDDVSEEEIMHIGQLELLETERRIHGQSTLVDRLPPEVLGDIFLQCLPGRNRRPSVTHAPLLLTRICWKWYCLAVELPHLWKKIVLDKYRDYRRGAPIQLLELWLARSKDSMLDLHIYAEMFAEPSWWEIVKRNAWRINHLSVRYRVLDRDGSDGVRLHCYGVHGSLVLPRLTSFEVLCPDKICSIGSSELSAIAITLNSASVLQRFVLVNASNLPGGPLMLSNWSNLEVLSLGEPVTLQLCLYVLQNIPTLRELSLIHIQLSGPKVPQYDDPNLVAALSQTLWPFTHPNLTALALSYWNGNMSPFFEFVALPKLEHLMLDLRSELKQRDSWPHEKFLKFLMRSDCRIQSFWVINQPFSSRQFAEMLAMPGLGEGLEDLLIQDYWGEGRNLDDWLLERLTFPSLSPSSSSPPPPPPPPPPADGEISKPSLCPNLAVLTLFVPFETYTFDKLISMLESRLPCSSPPSSPNEDNRSLENKVPFPLSDERATLGKLMRLLVIDLPREEDKLWSFNQLWKRGLVVRMHSHNNADSGDMPLPLTSEQRTRLQGYVAAGLRKAVFSYETGRWKGYRKFDEDDD